MHPFKPLHIQDFPAQAQIPIQTGRFALAINQAPLVRCGYLPLSGDWLANRVSVFRSRALPPVHLARRIMETCRSYDEARDALEQTPLALPAIFTLAGCKAGEGCVIERTQTRAWHHPAPAATANHWLSQGLKGQPRGIDSRRRLRLMNGLCRTRTDGFDWLIEPVLNPDTRLAVVANPAASLRMEARPSSCGAPRPQSWFPGMKRTVPLNESHKAATSRSRRRACTSFAASIKSPITTSMPTPPPFSAAIASYRRFIAGARPS